MVLFGYRRICFSTSRKEVEWRLGCFLHCLVARRPMRRLWWGLQCLHRCASFSIKAFPRSNCLPFLGRPQDGKSLPAYIKGPSRFDPLALSKAFFSHLKDNEIPSFLINVNDSGKLLLVENGRRFEALSIQLVILAFWKQALHICHAEAASAGRQSFRRGQNLGGSKSGPGSYSNSDSSMLNAVCLHVGSCLKP